MIRITGALAVTAAALIAVPAAAAHIEVSPSEAAANSYTKLTFSVPHGCGESGTTSLRVQIPGGVTVTPGVNPGWEVTTKEGTLPEPITVEGETITEGTTEVEWKGGPLPHDRYDEFVMSAHLPDKPGETLMFPIIQTCEQGETRWIEPTPAGGEEPEHPAPAVTLTAAGADEHGEEAEGGETPVANEASAEASDESDDTRANIALALGAAALIVAVGGAAVALRHR